VSGSHSDFDYQLPNTIQVPKSRCFVDSVHLGNIFPTITEHSMWIYLSERGTNNVITHRKIALTANKSFDGPTLAVEIAAKLNVGTTLNANSYTCTFDTTTGKLAIANSTSAPSTFSIWPAGYLKKATWNPGATPGVGPYIEGDDCYDIIGFVGDTGLTGAQTTVTGEGHINVMPYHTLFLHSDLGMQGDCIGPDNSSSIIRKIVIETGPGTQVNDFHSLPYDYVSVQPSQIRNIHFRLADYRGRTVDMLHTGLSFSLLFVPEDEL
jgi:hypothetical protein